MVMLISLNSSNIVIYSQLLRNNTHRVPLTYALHCCWAYDLDKNNISVKFWTSSRTSVIPFRVSHLFGNCSSNYHLKTSIPVSN